MERFLKVLKSGTDFLLGMAIGMVIIGALTSLLSCTPEVPPPEPVAVVPDCVESMRAWAKSREEIGGAGTIFQQNTQVGPVLCAAVEDTAVCRLLLLVPELQMHVLASSHGHVVMACDIEQNPATIIEFVVKKDLGKKASNQE